MTKIKYSVVKEYYTKHIYSNVTLKAQHLLHTSFLLY